MTASADAALFDALDALSVADDAAAFGVADAVDALGAVKAWAVVVMAVAP